MDPPAALEADSVANEAQAGFVTAGPPEFSWIADARSSCDEATGFVLRTLGRTDCERCWCAMRAWTDARTRDTPDELWITEHPPIYTLGLAGRREHVLRENAIPALKVDRGGQVTYHGPGQLVVYTMIDLRRRGIGVRELVVALENAVVALAARHGIAAAGRRDAPGVYVGDRKLASLGLRVRRGCSYHGLALNVDMDLEPFGRINPCGMAGLAMTQLAAEGASMEMDVRSVAEELAPLVCEALGLEWDGAWQGMPLPAQAQSATSTTPLSVRSW